MLLSSEFKVRPNSPDRTTVSFRGRSGDVLYHNACSETTFDARAIGQ